MEPDLDSGLGIAGPREIAGLRRFSHEAMNTVYEVSLVHADAQYAAQAARAAFDLIDHLEQALSRFRPNSDITRINDLAAGGSTRVGDAALECLVIARHIYDLTAGAFDISIGTGLPALEIDADTGTVHATADDVRVDLGGIGKGYAVDLVGELLEEWGIDRVLVHGGFSSMLALEPPEDFDGWPVTLSNPGRPSDVLHRLSLRQTAMSASGVRKGDHIVDPRSGQPVRGRKAAWASLPRPGPSDASIPGRVEGPRLAPAAIADALTTAFMILSAQEIADLCGLSPGLLAWVLSDEGILQSWP
jgi:thiamine biosynthesis lipoprotein